MGCSECKHWKAFDASGYWGECQIRACHSGDGKRMIMNRDEDCDYSEPVGNGRFPPVELEEDSQEPEIDPADAAFGLSGEE